MQRAYLGPNLLPLTLATGGNNFNEFNFNGNQLTKYISRCCLTLNIIKAQKSRHAKGEGLRRPQGAPRQNFLGGPNLRATVHV